MQTEEIRYVSPQVEIVEIKTQAIICQSGLQGGQNETYGEGSTEGWY